MFYFSSEDERYDLLKKWLQKTGRGRPIELPSVSCDNLLLLQLSHLHDECSVPWVDVSKCLCVFFYLGKENSFISKSLKQVRDHSFTGW